MDVLRGAVEIEEERGQQRRMGIELKGKRIGGAEVGVEMKRAVEEQRGRRG